jgi:preprotein translocase subunit SecB
MQLVETNGPAMLYGALREMIYTLTSRGPWPAVTLKSVTFLNSAEEAKSAVAKPAKASTGNPNPRRVAAKA